jgi:hypothetical protein
VRGEREGGGEGPPPERAVRVPRRADGVEGREPGQEDEERVRARLLRVPDEERVDGHERGGDEAGALGDQLAREREGERDGQDTRERRERSHAYLAGAEGARPEPGEHVIERRGLLRDREAVEEFAEVAAQQVDGGALVDPEALEVERGEAQGGRGSRYRREGEQRPVRARGRHAARLSEPTRM